MFRQGNLGDESNAHGGRSGSGLRMENSRGGSAMKSGVQQVDIGQYHDDQHDAHHGAQQEQCRRFYVPAAHEFVLFCQSFRALSRLRALVFAFLIFWAKRK